MPVRKRKQVEANDGSYAGRVLAAFDEMEARNSKIEKERRRLIKLVGRARIEFNNREDEASYQNLGFWADRLEEFERLHPLSTKAQGA